MPTGVYEETLECRKKPHSLKMEDLMFGILLKRCNKCGELKPLTEFHQNRANKDGHKNNCRTCENKSSRNYRLKNKERVRVEQHEYYIKHREYLSQRKKIWYQNNKTANQERTRNYFFQHREDPEFRQRKRAISKKFYLKNKDALHERRKLFRQENPELIAKQKREYNQTPNGRRAKIAQGHKRRAILRSCKINDLSKEEIKILLTKSFHCAICGEKFDDKRKKTIDHIVPVSKNGNNTLLNTQVICKSCNTRKLDRDYTKFNNGQILMFVS